MKPFLRIDAAGQGIPIDPRVFGSNLPAWLGPERLANPLFREQVANSGVRLVRLPGGSWSNGYDWLACQTGDEQHCYWPFAARPSDFIDFVRALDAEVIWTVSPNQTAQQAAALVAFFNGSPDDDRPLGVDLRGRDWLTVGHWARLRRDSGSPEPLGVSLWEFGNEVYGAKAAAAPGCASWGWEDVWTCDGFEYVNGIGKGSERHEGYLEFRAAMRAVDPTILLGAVGVTESASWSEWGNKVIASAGEVMDFYVVHHYGYHEPPDDLAQILAQPHSSWPTIVADINRAFDRYAGGRRVPIAVTEYNLFAFQEQDTGQLMTRAVNTLFLADTIGQLIQNGIGIANQWNLANGSAQNGTDYGLVHADSFAPYPQYYAFTLWSRVGSTLLPVSGNLAAATELSSYAGRRDDETLTLLAINKTSEPITATIELVGIDGPRDLRAAVAQADSLEATELRVNGIDGVSTERIGVPYELRSNIASAFDFTFPPFSITLIELSPAEAGVVEATP